MKRPHFSQHQTQKISDDSQRIGGGLNQNAINFSPLPDEVARKAYFVYENQGSLPGHDVQHWLAAEAELTAECNLTRVHGFHNKT
jgi:hypothetical protein